MKIKVLYFGVTADIIEKDSESFSDIPDTNSLNEKLIALYPGLRNANYQIAVNLEMINENKTLKEGDEVALLPPFAGG